MMKTKEVYKKNKNRRFCVIKDIKNKNIGIESNPIKSIKENWIKFLIGTLLILIILVVTFCSDWKILLSVLAFLAFIVCACILSNSYSMKCKDKTLSLKMNFQKFEISYSRIANIYLAREFSISDFFPMFTYSLVIRYIDNMNFLREISFSTLFLKPKEIEKFLENFIIDTEPAKQCIKYEKYKLGKNIIKLLGFILFVIAIVLVVYFSLK